MIYIDRTSVLRNVSFNVTLQEHIVSYMKCTVLNERRTILYITEWYHDKSCRKHNTRDKRKHRNRLEWKEYGKHLSTF